MDVHTPEQRRRNMSSIRSVDTKPEIVLRRMLHAARYRYRLHVRTLVGRPDIVFVSRKKAIFVNGCFWHYHSCQYGRVRPVTNAEFWQAKREATVARDNRNREALEKSGWKVHTVWECELKDPELAFAEVVRFLESTDKDSFNGPGTGTL